MKTRTRFAVAALVVGCFYLTGCGLYVVKKSTNPAPPIANNTSGKKVEPKGSHHGIPFYVKTAGCKREIAHLKPYYLLTLTEKDGEKVAFTDTTMVCRKNFASTVLDNLRSSSGTSLLANWKIVKALACEPHEEDAVVEKEDAAKRNWLLISDVTASYTYVDYDNPYTLKVRRPLIGSASATTKLADDGTLSEELHKLKTKPLELSWA